MTDPNRQDLQPIHPDGVICANCMTLNPHAAAYCRVCFVALPGGPPGTTRIPLVTAAGSRPGSGLVFWGAWAILGPSMMCFAMLGTGECLHFGPTESFPRGDLIDSIAALAVLWGIVAAHVVVLWKITRGYTRRLLKARYPTAYEGVARSSDRDGDRADGEPPRRRRPRQPVATEEAFPIHCAACDYLLTGLGEEHRCPECGRPFNRDDRLRETYGEDAFPDEDWALTDATHIGESRFPVSCAFCTASLHGAGEHGDCPSCGRWFIRAQRLFETYGPEVFADDPSWTRGGAAARRGTHDASTGVATLLWIIALPLVLGLSYSLVGDTNYVLAGGLVAALLALGYIFRHGHRD